MLKGLALYPELDKLLTEEEQKATFEALAAVPEGNSEERTG